VIKGGEILEQGFSTADLHGPLPIGEQPPEAWPLEQIPHRTQQRGVLAQKILHLAHQGPRSETGSALAGDQGGDLPAQFIVETLCQAREHHWPKATTGQLKPMSACVGATGDVQTKASRF
jgi:hypothetical protein